MKQVRATHQHLADRVAKNGEQYAADIAPAIVARDDEGITLDTTHPAWVNAVKKYARGAAGVTRAVLRLDPVPTDVEAERSRVCGACEHNVGRLLKTCDLCGCGLRLKVKNAGESCPEGKWGKHGA